MLSILCTLIACLFSFLLDALNGGYLLSCRHYVLYLCLSLFCPYLIASLLWGHFSLENLLCLRHTEANKLVNKWALAVQLGRKGSERCNKFLWQEFSSTRQLYTPNLMWTYVVRSLPNSQATFDLNTELVPFWDSNMVSSMVCLTSNFIAFFTRFVIVRIIGSSLTINGFFPKFDVGLDFDAYMSLDHITTSRINPSLSIHPKLSILGIGSYMFEKCF